MAREKEAYRDNLELILSFLREKYGGRRMMLTNRDVQEFTGLKYEYVRSNFMRGERFVSAAVLARLIS